MTDSGDYVEAAQLDNLISAMAGLNGGNVPGSMTQSMADDLDQYWAIASGS